MSYVSPGHLTLVVSGTRDADPWLYHAVPYYVDAVFKARPHRHGQIRVGCARGVDAIVRDNYPVWIVSVHYARWDALGKRAGMVRNEEMLDCAVEDASQSEHNTVILLAFPRIGGRGTQGCIKSALKRGIEVWEVPVEGHGYTIHAARKV